MVLMHEKCICQADRRTYNHSDEDEIEPNARVHPTMQTAFLNTGTFSGHCHFLQL